MVTQTWRPWDATAQRLIRVDILRSRVHTHTPATGRRTVMATEQHVGAAKPCVDGGLVINLRDGMGRYGRNGAFAWLLRDPVPGRRGNDAAVAPDGALWAGTMRYDEAPGGGNLGRLAPDGTARETLPGVTVSNGIGWSPDGSLMYYVDSPRAVSTTAPRRRTRHPPTTPGEAPHGLRLRRAPELRDLYITTARTGEARPHPPAGSLLVLRTAGQGLPGVAFGG
ncbi:SMP-30/gluconolactonase/LRE family protein [Streptomyces sp. NPDC046182]|uniref:SMP-30/gluconolactonase/LRE family protein n=1 Tax=Streptomyces sp. NPDC046182 TaxID=3154601 RepID=UPI0033E9DB37